MEVFVEDRDPAIEKMFMNNGWAVSNTHEGVNLICFGGGADVTPALYNEKNTHSNCDIKRDLYCIFLYNYARSNSIPCVGICRGGQFLNVMNGGKMIQDFPGHGRDHIVNTFDKESIFMSSTHHQVMIPSKLGELLGWGNTKKEVEIVLYDNEENTGCLCFQPHPEYFDKNHECQKVFFEYIQDFLAYEYR